MTQLVVDIALAISSVGVGYGIGYKHSASKQYKEIKKHCDILFEHNKTTWKEPIVHYHGNKIFTNTCSSLVGKKCKYTQEKCILL